MAAAVREQNDGRRRAAQGKTLMNNRKRRDVGWASKQVAEAEERVKNSPKLFLTETAAWRLRDGGDGPETEQSARNAGEQGNGEKISGDEAAAQLASLPCYEAPWAIFVDGSAVDQRNSGAAVEQGTRSRCGGAGSRAGGSVTRGKRRAMHK